MSQAHPASAQETARQLFDRVPFFRRNGPVSALLFASLILGLIVPMSTPFVLPPALAGLAGYASQGLAGLSLLAVCGIVLSGPVYMAQLDDKAQLKRWGAGNKVVAALLLGAWIYFIVRQLMR